MGSLPIKGSLFISGVGRVPELHPRFLKAAGGKGERILTIPGSNDLTQSDDVQRGWPTIPEFGDSGVFEVDIDAEHFQKKWGWTVHWSRDFEIRNGAVLHTASREIANSDALCEEIRKAGGLFFTTGTASKAMATHRGTKAHSAFPDLVGGHGSRSICRAVRVSSRYRDHDTLPEMEYTVCDGSSCGGTPTRNGNRS
ncbi:MAG: hypothetical protein CME19_13610 [Gemmatimonadetes bacterium]|nr:hypothetical protein [Gemmatimonadota bacterium]